MRRKKDVPHAALLADGWEVLGLLVNIGANHCLITAAMQTPLSYPVSAMREDDTLHADEETLPLNV
jgi:hypothetical protein